MILKIFCSISNNTIDTAKHSRYVVAVYNLFCTFTFIYLLDSNFLWINFMHKNAFYGKPSWTRKSYQIKVHPHNHNIYIYVFFQYFMFSTTRYWRISKSLSSWPLHCKRSFSSQCLMLSLSIFLQDDQEFSGWLSSLSSVIYCQVN